MLQPMRVQRSHRRQVPLDPGLPSGPSLADDDVLKAKLQKVAYELCGGSAYEVLDARRLAIGRYISSPSFPLVGGPVKRLVGTCELVRGPCRRRRLSSALLATCQRREDEPYPVAEVATGRALQMIME